MTDDPKKDPRFDLGFHKFMCTSAYTEDAGRKLGEYVGKYGDEICLKTACGALNTGFVDLLFRADAKGFHQEVSYENGAGEKKTGSLLDYSIAVARTRGTECPEPLIKLLLGRGVEAAADCDHPTIVRYRTALSPNAPFTKAAYDIPTWKEIGAKAASAAFRFIGSFSPFTAKRDLEIN